MKNEEQRKQHQTRNSTFYNNKHMFICLLFLKTFVIHWNSTEKLWIESQIIPRKTNYIILTNVSIDIK